MEQPQLPGDRARGDVGRLKTAYMTCAYLGGSAGSWLGARVWALAGWWGVCTLLALLTALALARHLAAPRSATGASALSRSPAADR
ncbi:hypothetical protein ACFV1W_09310 [Kitasatospora sp. NPDC059648]|uniref:hypothetical protein n=1 Tax=Kitasatospora sp. NPDC059648 TaxID=3346894 RepID=UPI0036933263